MVTSARRKIFPRALIVMIPSLLLAADNPITYIHEMTLETILINLAFKRVEYIKIYEMFEATTELREFQLNLTTAGQMYTNARFPYCLRCIVTWR
jgi:hypothetical protein